MHKKALLIIDHGSKKEEANLMLFDVVQAMQKKRPDSNKKCPDPTQNAPTRCPYDLLHLARAIMPEALNTQRGVADVHPAPHPCFRLILT